MARAAGYDYCSFRVAVDSENRDIGSVYRCACVALGLSSRRKSTILWLHELEASP